MTASAKIYLNKSYAIITWEPYNCELLYGHLLSKYIKKLKDTRHYQLMVMIASLFSVSCVLFVFRAVHVSCVLYRISVLYCISALRCNVLYQQCYLCVSVCMRIRLHVCNTLVFYYLFATEIFAQPLLSVFQKHAMYPRFLLIMR